MSAKYFGKILIVVAFVVLFFLLIQLFSGDEQEEEYLSLALVGPKTGRNPENFKAYQEGIRLYIDKINLAGGINGRKIRIDEYDDQNDPRRAADKAKEIIDHNRALAVIGHNYSKCSIAGGEIYQRYGIPAISPSSTSPPVTVGRDWYFRTVFNDNLEGSFLANYLAKVFQRRQAAVIFERTVYGRALADIFIERCRDLGVTVPHIWSYDDNDPRLDEVLEGIVDELATTGYNGMILLALQAPEGVKIVHALRERNLKNQLLTPNAFASRTFQEGFGQYKKERQHPGYYTNGTYVSSPLLFDSADEDGQKFRTEYRERWGAEPDWRAAFAHDAVLLLVEAIKTLGCTGDPAALQAERRQIRDWLASLTKIDDAIKGATGFNYFDENGDPPRPIFLGMYRDNNIISTLTQFQAIPNLSEITDLDSALREERILEVNNTLMYKTNVVYTGFTVNDISNLDMRKLTCDIDLNLWFRHQGDIDVTEIVFGNAASPIELGEPITRERAEGLSYELYRVQGTFKADFLPTDSLEHHVIGVSLYHRGLTRNNLIYVTDVLGMGLTTGDSFFERLSREQVLSRSSGWTIKDARFFQDVLERGPEGNPLYLNVRQGVLKHSRFNLKILISKERFGLRRSLTRGPATVLLVLGLLLMLSCAVVGRTAFGNQYYRLTWFFLIIAGMTSLLSAETVLIARLMSSLSRYYLELITRIFDVLWWLVPAYFLIRTIDTFIWIPLERRAHQTIPKIVRRFTAFLIYTTALFAIIAFVFDQRITSLLATSGMIAMIVGLAIQINISNIFSGIALNLERPFRVGEWVKIGNLEEAKVVDMTWRTTRLLLRDATVLSIPNSFAAESQMVNYSRPEEWYELWIFFHVDPTHPPTRVIKITLDALNSLEFVRKDPKPGCRFIGYTEWSAEFVAVPVLDGYAKRNVQRGAIMTHLWTELHRAGIRQAIRVHEVHMLRGSKESGELAGARREDILESVDIFQQLSDEAKAHLTANMREQRYETGDTIVTQGDEGDSLFIIVEGVVGVWIKLASGESIEVDRMGAGTFFGEMALLTGAARTASIIAVTDTHLYEITKADFAPLITAQPELSKILSEELTRRTINREAKRSSAEAQKTDEKALYLKIFHKIQTFFGSGGEGQ